MYTIDKEVCNELVINKSTFITYLSPVNNLKQAKDYINNIKIKHPDATHHVSCYQVGKTAEAGHYDDDGEPSKTAGMPAIDVFRKNDITNFVCVIVRYFGGIKLGAGGLIRAYSKSASTALSLTQIVEIITYKRYQLSFHYSYVNVIDTMLEGSNILQKSFSDNVSYVVEIDEKNVYSILNQLISLTNNMIKILEIKVED